MGEKIKRFSRFLPILSGNVCKSGPPHFGSEKRFSLKLCPGNHLALPPGQTRKLRKLATSLLKNHNTQQKIKVLLFLS